MSSVITSSVLFSFYSSLFLKKLSKSFDVIEYVYWINAYESYPIGMNILFYDISA